MATIKKNTARKPLAVGQPSLGYVDLPQPLLLTRKHVSIQIGDHTVRIELDKAKDLAIGILDLHNQYGHKD